MKFLLISFGCVLALFVALGLVVTRSTVVEEKSLRFDDGLTLSYRMTNEGGAWGNVRYEIFAQREGRKSKVFEGISAEHFDIRKGGARLIRVRFCNGTIEHLSAVFFEKSNRSPVIIQPEIYCPSVR